MKLFTFLYLFLLSLFSCNTSTKAIKNSEKPICKVLINFGSRGSGIDYTRYEELMNTLKAKKINYTERSCGKEGEKEICLPLTELSGKEKNEFIEQLKTFENKPTLISLSIN